MLGFSQNTHTISDFIIALRKNDKQRVEELLPSYLDDEQALEHTFLSLYLPGMRSFLAHFSKCDSDPDKKQIALKGFFTALTILSEMKSLNYMHYSYNDFPWDRNIAEIFNLESTSDIIQHINKQREFTATLPHYAHSFLTPEPSAHCLPKLQDPSSAIIKELDEQGPLLQGPIHENSSLIDVLLSKSYSTTISKERITEAYEFLLNLDPMAYEMLVVLGNAIRMKDDVKIYFDKKFDSKLLNNLIMISDDPQKEIHKGPHLMEGTLIHEIGHWFYNEIFDFESLPFSKDELLKHLGRHEDDHDFKKSNMDIYLSNVQKLGIKTPISEYMEAANKPLIELAEIVGMPVSRLNHLRDLDNCDTLLSDIPSLIALRSFGDEERVFGMRIVEYCGRIFINKEEKATSDPSEELIVRYLELKAYGLGEELLSSFDALKAYHSKYVTPVVAPDADPETCYANPKLPAELLTCPVDDWLA